MSTTHGEIHPDKHTLAQKEKKIGQGEGGIDVTLHSLWELTPLLHWLISQNSPRRGAERRGSLCHIYFRPHLPHFALLLSRD